MQTATEQHPREVVGQKDCNVVSNAGRQYQFSCQLFT